MTAGLTAEVAVPGVLQCLQANSNSKQEQAITDLEALHTVSHYQPCLSCSKPVLRSKPQHVQLLSNTSAAAALSVAAAASLLRATCSCPVSVSARCETFVQRKSTFSAAQVTSCGLTAQQAKQHITSVSVINQGAQLAFWPPALCTFTALSSINLSGNAITFIPQSIQALTGLKV
jgi:hypothetical protein